MSEFFAVIKTRFALLKSQIDFVKYVIKYGKMLFELVGDLNKGE